MLRNDPPDTHPAKRYTEAQAARMLGVHRHTMERWRKAGETRYKISKTGHIYYSGTEIIRIWQTR